MPKLAMVGIEVKPVVIAVNVSPKTVLPLIITVPDNAALVVLIGVVELAGDAK